VNLFESISVDWSVVGSHLVLMGVAFILALPVALNRERASRSAGLRTYPLVAIATCGLTLIAIRVLDSPDAESRIMQGIITGMGFIGGGAILKGEKSVVGLATAASLWATGAMGVAVAWQRYEIALVLSVLMFAALSFGTEAKNMVDSDESERESLEKED